MVAPIAQQPFSVAKIPVSCWTFAVHVWLATIPALFVSFWLQLEAPFTAAVTVAILAEPTRGQALDKAGFRLIATIVGVTASIAITGLFSQARDLMPAASSAWLGLCVFAAKLLDGYRAYAAVLSGYTVEGIAIQQIDSPQHVFEASVERGAAIAVGSRKYVVVCSRSSSTTSRAAGSTISRRASEHYPGDKQIASSSAKSMSRPPGIASRTARLLLRKLATAGMAVVAVLGAVMTWDLYNAAPWTRDGSVRVQVASVAPQISGQIKELRVVCNQLVHKGDVLYVIDPFDFEVALRGDKAALQQKIADRDVKGLQAERRRRLSDLATSVEEKQVYNGNAIPAKAAVDLAQEQVAQAEINLQRAEVRSPVNGIVTNLLLQQGDRAHQGTPNVSIIDTDSYWIDGYFEETKLARLCVGTAPRQS